MHEYAIFSVIGPDISEFLGFYKGKDELDAIKTGSEDFSIEFDSKYAVVDVNDIAFFNAEAAPRFTPTRRNG